jgi:phosphatidylserine/phosphatidylglycerophosphate/cardiolipin synthase-like enzyme
MKRKSSSNAARNKQIARRLGALFGALIVIAAIASISRFIPPVLPGPPTPAPTPTLPTGSIVDVDLIVLPDDGQSVVADRVAQAKNRVMMKMYLLTDAQMFEALRQAKANGADVRVMIEQRPFGGSASARAAYDKLKAAGINIKYANPAFRFTHEKSFVIDDFALILTANMTRSSVTRNREFGVVHTDPTDVAEIVSAFDADWSRDTFKPNSPNLVWSPVNARERIDSLIRSAKHTLDVYAPASQDDEQIRLLTEAAKRGVHVRFLTSPSRSEDEEESSANQLDELQRGGVDVRTIQSPYIHAKVFVADASTSDARTFVGSVNISTTSLDFNRELGLIFNDPDAIQRLQRTFQADWDRATER